MSEISEELLKKVRNFLEEHRDFSEQPNETAKDAYVYHLVKLVLGELK